MPLHSVDPALPLVAERLDDPIPLRARLDHQSLAERFDRLVVDRIDLRRAQTTADFIQQRSGLDQKGVWSKWSHCGNAIAKNEWLGVLNWYPIYGKVNLFDLTVAHFDVYILGGAGQINLSSGTAPLYSAGGGMGIWWNQHLTTRLEARWQGYRDSIFDGEKNLQRDINQTLLTVNVGLLL